MFLPEPAKVGSKVSEKLLIPDFSHVVKIRIKRSAYKRIYALFVYFYLPTEATTMNHHELITSKELAPLFIEVATKMIARGLCERNKLPQDSFNKFVGDLLRSQEALIDALTKMNMADSEIEQIANKGVIYYQHQVFLSPGP